jgi:hypothetical protein
VLEAKGVKAAGAQGKVLFVTLSIESVTFLSPMSKGTFIGTAVVKADNTT